MNTKSDSTNLRVVAAHAETRGYDEPQARAPWYDDIPPSRIGRYLVLSELGRGGMGVVWTAYDPKLERKVAIKLLHGARGKTGQARFIREAQALAKLNHPNIVTIHDVDTHEGELYMAMEFVDGQTLDRWVSAGRSWSEIVEALCLAGQGLAAAHAANITHRDFKPSNVLVAYDGQVKVLDFGLAKTVSRACSEDESSSRSESGSVPLELSAGLGRDSDIMQMIDSSGHRLQLTKVGRIVGTPAYMAPEQHGALDRHEVGAWTDQFSFGIALYEALYGEMPFGSEDLYTTFQNIRDGNICEPGRDTAVPGWVLRVIERAVQYNPHHRYPSMAALLAALQDDPARRRRRRLGYASGVGLLGLAAYGMVEAATPKPAPVPCQGAQEHLSGVWDDQARDELGRAMVATEQPYAVDTARRVTAALDLYAATWVEQHTAVCEATRIKGEQSEALLDVRMTCLDRRRGELAALVGVLTSPEDDTVARAVAAVDELRPAEPCASARPGIENDVPVDPARRAEFDELQARIDRAGALLIAGRYADTRALAAAAAEDAKVTGFVRLLALALKYEGQALHHLGEADMAQQRLRESVIAASEVGDGRTEVAAWVQLLYTTGVRLHQPERAADWQFAAENAVRRVGSPPRLESQLAVSVSAVMLKQHRLDDANEAGETALRLALEVDGRGSLLHARALTNLGVVAAKQANWKRAEQRLRESYELKKQILGPAHPDVINNGMNLANVLVQYARDSDREDEANASYDEAESLYSQGVTSRERSEGPHSKSVARALAMLGLLQANRGKTTQARQTLERAARLLRAETGTTGDLAKTLTNLAKAERRDQDYTLAEQHYREAIALQTSMYGHSHPAVETTRVQLCGLYGDAKRYEDAMIECEQVISTLEGSDSKHARRSLLLAHDVMAYALQALGRPQLATDHKTTAQALVRLLSEQP